MQTLAKPYILNYTHIDPSKVDFVEIGSLDQLPNGERLFVEVDDKAIVVFNIAGQLFAIGDVCSHDEGPLGDGEVIDYEVGCPRHGARFDVRSGKAIQLPAVADIPAYPVRIREGKVEIGIPKD